MDYFADIFLGAGALAAAFYCLVLSRKLSRLSGLDQDLGSAIAVLSKQVDDMTNVLSEAKKSSKDTATHLVQLTERAEEVSAKLEIMLGALEDLPEIQPDPPNPTEVSQPFSKVQNPEESSIFVRHSKRVGGTAI